MFNKVILHGRLTKDPEFRQTQSGTAVARFTVAINRQFANKQTGERESDFIECTAFKNTAEFISRYFSKGSLILAEGELRNNNYTDNNGVKHFTYQVLVSNVSFGSDKANQNSGQQRQQPQYGSVNQRPQNDAPVQEISGEEWDEILSDGDIPF